MHPKEKHTQRGQDTGKNDVSLGTNKVKDEPPGVNMPPETEMSPAQYG